MNTVDWVVALAGLAAIAWINWYFFFAERRAVVAATSGNLQEVRIEVKGGYDPGTVRLRRGVRTRLIFDRQETSSCSEEVVIPEFGVKKFLPPFRQTAVEITPEKAGAFDITCGMSMLHGTLLVED